MATVNKLGIWMDHSSAQLMEFNKQASPIRNIRNTFSHAAMEKALHKSESLMHNKRQQQQAAFYKELGEVIIQYKEILLFGPTDAKTELLNSLRKDLQFEKIEIEVRSTGKMTANQQLAFVKDHFSPE